VLGVAMGPSGDIGGAMLGSLMEVMDDLFNWQTVSLTDDIIRTMRNFSGVDNMAKAWGIMQNGQLRARSGKVAPYELDTGDAIAQLLGFSARETTEWYQRQRFMYQDDRAVKDFTTQMQNDFAYADTLIKGDNPEAGYQLLREINTKIKLSGFTGYQIGKILGNLRVPSSQAIWDMVLKNHQNERHFTGDVIEQTFTPLGGNH